MDCLDCALKETWRAYYANEKTIITFVSKRFYLYFLREVFLAKNG